MLTLLKFDIKNTWFKIFAYCIAVAVFTALTIYFWSHPFEGFFNNENFYWITIFKFGSLGVTGAVCCICLLMTFVTLAQWFAQNLLADEGHFMNMLPVSRAKLFLSKTLAALLWNSVLIGFMLGCVFVFLLFGGRLAQINDIIIDLVGEGGEIVHVGQLMIKFGVFMALYSTSLCILSYTAVCVGHTVNIGKNVLTLIGFIGIGLAELVIAAVLAAVLGVFNLGDLTSLAGIISYMGSFCVKMTAVCVINGLITFALGTYLLSGRLNIE